MSPYSIANQISFSFLHLIHPLLHIIFADVLYHPERWKSLKSSHWRSKTLSRQLVREWSTLKINQENTCQHSLWKFNKFKPHGSANVQRLLHKDKLHFSSRWCETSKGKQHFSIPFLCLFHLISMDGIFHSHQIVREIWAKRLVFDRREPGGIFPLKSPPCKAHCSASSKIKRLKAMRDSTVFIFQPWFQVDGWKLCNGWYPICIMSSWWFNTSWTILDQNGNLPQNFRVENEQIVETTTYRCYITGEILSLVCKSLLCFAQNGCWNKDMR